MKYIYLTLGIGLLILTSCFDDLGDYDYKDINEVEIEGLDDYYRVDYPDGVLQIDPELESSFNDMSPDRYSYEWKAVQSTPITASFIIGTEKTLNSENLGLLPGSYDLYFKVLDKKTDLIWKKRTTLNVATSTSRGFLLMGNNKEGYMQLDMLKMPAGGDTIIALDLLRNANLPPIKNAKSVMFSGAAANMDNSKFWIMGENESYYVDRTTFEAEPTNILRPMIFSSYDEIPDKLTVLDVAPRVSRANGTSVSSNRRAISTKEGHVFSTSNLIAGDLYGNPINRTNPNKNEYFKASPYLMYSLYYWRNMIIYDEDSDRFTSLGSFDSNVTTLYDGAFDPFPWNQKDNGRKLIYAENTKSAMHGAGYGITFGLMKDNNAGYHIYMFDAVFNTKYAYYFVKKEIASNLDAAANKKLVTFASFRTLMLYADGDNLYYYDYNKGNEKGGLLKNFNGEEITMIHFDIQTENNGNRDLYVATKNSSGEGILRKLVLGTNVDVIDYEIEDNTEWRGLSAIVKMDWRNRE